jgi:hypothetical protein
VRPERLSTHFSPKVTSEARAIVNGTAYEVRPSERATRASKSRLVQSLSTQPRLHSSYLIFLALPCRSSPNPSIAARLELPRSLKISCSDRLRDRCKVGPAVPELPETRPESDQTACMGPRLPLAPQKRACLHQNGLASTTLIYPQNTSHSPLRTVFAFLQKGFPTPTPETPYTPTQQLTSTQLTPT